MRTFYTTLYKMFCLKAEVISFCPIFAQILSAWKKHKKGILAYGGCYFLLLLLVL
jgi:hypothetical protein